ncbi:MAG: aminoacyl-tRNA hydrolase [Pseudomonadota bacterium]
MSDTIQLVAGLGNPGDKYAATRHNAGFWFLDRVADALGGQFRTETRFLGQVCEVLVGPHKVRLLKPTTFMNRSGQSVAALARFYRIPAERVLVVHDELDLPPGVVRMKTGGGPGGHNGLKDVIAHLGDRGFHRMRLGIGRPRASSQVLSFVLKRPGSEERILIDEAIRDAHAEFAEIVAGKLMVVMNRLHTRKDEPVTPPVD